MENQDRKTIKFEDLGYSPRKPRGNYDRLMDLGETGLALEIAREKLQGVTPETRLSF